MSGSPVDVRQVVITAATDAGPRGARPRCRCQPAQTGGPRGGSREEFWGLTRWFPSLFSVFASVKYCWAVEMFVERGWDGEEHHIQNARAYLSNLLRGQTIL